MAETTKKTKSIKDFRGMDEKALQTKIAELRAHLAEHHRSLSANELPSTSVIAKTRKDIAKALTVMGEHRRQEKEQEK
ncbi:MAG TPA: 50S ribosomal protein L29 [Candidatus Saccharimonadales bacterium]|nr:50S ribosomal protein L29 [Candidatus Saccharimonadales bacterium]